MIKEDSTKDIVKKIIKLAIPASLEMIFQNLLGLIDIVFISALGDDAMAGVSLVNQIITLLLLVFGTLGVGGSILIAQYYGKKDKDSIVTIVGQLFLFGLSVSAITIILLTLFQQRILTGIGVTKEVMGFAEIYFRIVIISMPVAVFINLLTSVLRAVGNTRTSMLSNVTSLAVNTVLNYVLIFGIGSLKGFGIAGAAYATLISRCVGFIILTTYLLFFNKEFDMKIKAFIQFNKEKFLHMCKLSIPVTVGEGVWAAGSFLYTLLHTRIGTTALVANQMLFSVEEIFIMFSFGLSVAGLTVVGQEIGRKNYDLMHLKAKIILKTGFVSSVIFGILFFITSFFLSLIYSHVAEASIQLAVIAIHINALFQPIKVTNLILGNGILKGGGDTSCVMIIDTIVVTIGVITAYILGYGFELGFLGVFFGKLIEEIIRFLFMMGRYKSDKWFKLLV